MGHNRDLRHLANHDYAFDMTLPDFLDSSPSPAWAAETATQLLTQAGFIPAADAAATEARRFFVRPQPGMVYAVSLPEDKKNDNLAFRIVGAHTDSPHLRLKPNADFIREGMRLVATEVYGGALLYTWFDRDLGIAGEVYFRDRNGISMKLVRINRAIASVPSLAIHLQRAISEEGFAPNKQTETNALISGELNSKTLREYIAAEAGIAETDILSYDLSLYDVQKAQRTGTQNEYLASARLDNLVSCYAALTALIENKPENSIQIVALYDHEEIGSNSESGAETALTEKLLLAIKSRLRLSDAEYHAVLAKSLFLSADMAHGVHPNYADKHDAQNRPRLGGGVTLKVNQNRRYASSAATQAVFYDICKRHNLPHQTYTHRNDLPCGSTIGPTVSAKLGMPTIDAGIAMLAMHSIRETCAYADVEVYSTFMGKFLTEI
jgi:aspartyl aminopeptidase